LRIILFLLVISINLYSQPQGKVKLDHYTFNTDKSIQDLKISAIIWYNGSRSIQEVPHLNINTDSTGTSTNSYVKYYLFIDSEEHQFFYYGNFSDTSKAIMHFTKIIPFEKYGGWDLYSNKLFKYNECKKLTDTVINGNRYSRYRLRKFNNDDINEFILYAICERKDVPIKYLKSFSEKIGCPIIRMDTYFADQLAGIAQITYISDSLTSYELKVFEAWEKNFKKYPANK